MDPEEAARLLIDEYSRMAREYDARVSPYHAPLARRLTELADLKPGERVLDVGCGTGIATFEAAKRVSGTGLVVGIDFSEGAIRVAAEKALSSGLRRVHFVTMDARRLAFPDRSFDAILSCLGHPAVGHPGFLVEAHRVLRPRRRFALCTGTDLVSPVGKAFRDVLERLRPAVLSRDVALLVEARKTIAATAEAKEMLRPEGWIHGLQGAGFSHVQVLEETHSIVYPSPDAYLDYSFAWGDNERELSQMTEETRTSLRSEFKERVASMVTQQGLVVSRPSRYYVAEK